TSLRKDSPPARGWRWRTWTGPWSPRTSRPPTRPRATSSKRGWPRRPTGPTSNPTSSPMPASDTRSTARPRPTSPTSTIGRWRSCDGRPLMDLPPSSKAKADRFRKLHDRKHLLVLPNAWDVASARIFEETGFPAIATTSAGIAYSLGYSDRERISRSEMAAAVRRIAEAVRLPVSADVEAGYGGRTSDVVETIDAILDAGAIGVNLEDATHSRKKALFDLAVQEDRIHAARSAAKKAGLPLVINARTDVFLLA